MADPTNPSAIPTPEEIQQSKDAMASLQEQTDSLSNSQSNLDKVFTGVSGPYRKLIMFFLMLVLVLRILLL